MKRLKAIFTTTILFVVAVSVSGQTTKDSKQEKPYIEVTGHALRRVMPDEVYISFSIEDSNITNDKAIEKKEQELKSFFAHNNISLKSLVNGMNTSDHSLKITWAGKESTINARNYMITLNSLKNISKVFKKFDQLGIKGHISALRYSKYDSLKKQVQLEAIKNAKSQATYMLSAVGEKPGKTLIVRTTGGDYSYDVIDKDIYPSKNTVWGKNGAYKENYAIRVNQIVVSATIYVKFLIE